MSVATEFITKAAALVQQILETQAEAIEAAAEICAESIANEAWTHLFGCGHSRMMAEEMFPRIGSLVGFHPIEELSLSHHTNVVGPMGQQQALFHERQCGFAEVILKNYTFTPHCSFILISNSGINEVPVEMAMGVKERGMPLICITSMEHTQQLPAKHPSGKKMYQFADVVIDNCCPTGDAVMDIDGLHNRVGPTSTITGATIINAIKSQTAHNLVQRGYQPIVLPTHQGNPRAAEELEALYSAYKERMRKI